MWVADLSSAWPTLTGSVLKGLGASGVVGYIGCDNTAKNVSKARFQDWLDNGLLVALVIENGAQDVLGGSKAGAYMGQKWLAGAEAVGYDVAHCVGFTSGDFNAQPSQFDAILACQQAFASYVPVPGYYGNSGSIAHLIDYGAARVGWQSSSKSFSGPNPAIGTTMLQRFADPRAQGLALDVNDVIAQPLYFMGENVALTQDDANLVAAAVWGERVVASSPVYPNGLVKDLITNSTAWVSEILTAVGTPAPIDVQALAAALADPLATAIVAKLPTNSALTAQDVQNACSAALAGTPLLADLTLTIGAKTS